MDSGRVFRALIWKITGNAGKGRHWAVISGKIIAYGLMMTGMLIALQPDIPGPLALIIRPLPLLSGIRQ